MAEKYPREFGAYRLLRKVAQGGMAEIFLAQDKKGRVCAIKRILPHLAHEESFIRMFIDEARIVSLLKHPNIAGVYDQGKHEGFYYIAMEFVQGQSLLAVFERAKSMKMPLPRGLLSFIVAEILAALGAAHSAVDGKGRHLGIVHRDVTPQNVLISYSGEVKLIDFGVAKARARLTQTEAGFTKGKLSYMSPEQARGEELDGRSDLFSVGIILYEITTGTRLFNKEGPGGILGAIVNDPVPLPSSKARDFPRDLEDIVMRALEKSVRDRWQSAEEMRDALLRFARKERPAPGRTRLADLVHDLFGEPEIQKLIDDARASFEEQPASSLSQLSNDGSIPAFGTDLRALHLERSGQQPRDDETRMMMPEFELAPEHKSVSQVEVTGDGVPVVDIPLSSVDAPVPEPEVPLRVRLAQFLDELSSDLALSWREHRRRYLAAAGGLSVALLILGGFQSGLFSRVLRWTGGGIEAMRSMKAATGMSPSALDADVNPTVLHLVSEPPGAVILVDGIGMGSVTPAELTDLPTGREIEIELRLVGYRPKKDKLTLFENEGRKDFSLTLDRMSAAMRIETDPPGANVQVDGKALGQPSPVNLEGLPVGSKIRVQASLKGYEDRSEVVILEDQEMKLVKLELPIDERQIPPGTLRVESSPVGCDAIVDGALVGPTPIVATLREGPHDVRVSCQYYGEQGRAVSVVSGQERRVFFELQPTQFGYLTLRIIPNEPADTIVHIGGERVELPIEFRKVIPGNHEVVVENRRLSRSKRVVVSVGPRPVDREINLLQ